MHGRHAAACTGKRGGKTGVQDAGKGDEEVGQQPLRSGSCRQKQLDHNRGRRKGVPGGVTRNDLLNLPEFTRG